MSSRFLMGIGAVLLACGAILLAVQATPALQVLLQAPATLQIQANNAGIHLVSGDGTVTAYVAGSQDKLLARGQIGENISLGQGHYDIQVRFTRTSDQQSLWLRNLELGAGERAVKTVEFSAGEIRVVASVGSEDSEPGEVVVYVYRPGEHDKILTSVPGGQATLLGVGQYDLRVVWSVDAQEKDVRWYRGVQVKVGLQTTLDVPFNRGVLMVGAENNGEPLASGAVVLTVYRAGDTQQEVVDTGSSGVPLGLASGSYDIKATYRKSNDKPDRWLRDIAIGDGQVVNRIVEYSSGSMVVNAAQLGGNALDPYDAYIYYYRAGVHEQAVGYTPAGVTAILEQGQYDVRARYFRSNDQPDTWLRGLQVKAGEVLNHTVYFRSGGLLVRAYDGNGEELIGDNVFVYIYAADHRRRYIAKLRSGELATLTVGTYDIRIVDTRSDKTIAWLSGVELQPGTTSEQFVTVPDS